LRGLAFDGTLRLAEGQASSRRLASDARAPPARLWTIG